MQKILFNLAAASALGLTLIAAKPPQPPADVDPEIGYTYSSSKYMDLRLANRAGTAAVLVHRTNARIAGFDLAPERSEAGAANRIAFVDGENLYVKTWTRSPFAVSGETQLVFDGIGWVETLDFSPDGSRLIFNTLGHDTSRIWIHDFEPGESEPVQRVLTDQYTVMKVRWDDTGTSAFFVGWPADVDPGSAPALYKIDLSGAVTKLRDVSANAMEIDVTRGPPSAKSRIVHSAAGVLNLLTFDGDTDRKIADGSLAHFNCNNSAIIHRGNDRRRSTVITPLAPGNVAQIWSTDSNIHHTDWLPRAACSS